MRCPLLESMTSPFIIVAPVPQHFAYGPVMYPDHTEPSVKGDQLRIWKASPSPNSSVSGDMFPRLSYGE